MNLKKFDLTGKNGLITGGAGLLGREHAEALLEAGANVVITDIDENNINKTITYLEKGYGQKRVIGHVMNVSKKEEIEKTLKELNKNKVRIDILINNAAIDPKVTNEYILKGSSRLENITLEQWDMQLSVGLTGAFLCSQVFGKKMAEDDQGGVILNIASDLSVFAPDQRIYKTEGLEDDKQPVKPVTYSVIKTGLLGLTRYIATYWNTQNVRCNALSPGGIYVDQSEEFVEKLTKLIPLGRMAKKEEYRSAVQFLCSDASSYMNGQNVVIDGGRSAW